MPVLRPYVDMKKATTAFAAGVNYLSRLTGLNKRQIVLAEAGSILKACAADTPVADEETVEKGATLRALRGLALTRGGQFTVNAGVRGPYGRVFMMKKGGAGAGYRRVMDGGWFVIQRQHYKDSDWLALNQTVQVAQAKILRATVKAQGTVALARGSWVRAAHAAGIRLEDVKGGRLSPTAIAEARAAHARNGQERNNGAALIFDDPKKFFVTLINRYPGGGKLKFETMLAAKVSGRALFMARAVQKGFDGSAQQMARLFPGWTVKTGQN